MGILLQSYKHSVFDIILGTASNAGNMPSAGQNKILMVRKKKVIAAAIQSIKLTCQCSPIKWLPI